MWSLDESPVPWIMLNTAMILAAGRGERMRPLTDHTPKPLLAVHDKPLIVWLLDSLARAGFTRVVINLAHLGEQIANHLGNGTAFGLDILYSHENPALETAGGIAHALPLLGAKPFLVINGDIWTNFDFSRLRQRRWLKDDLAYLVLVANPPHHMQGDFCLQTLASGARVHDNGKQRFTFSGIGCYHPQLFGQLDGDLPAPLAPLLRQAMTENKVGGEFFSGCWQDIGTPERLAQLDENLRKQAAQPRNECTTGTGNGC